MELRTRQLPPKEPIKGESSAKLPPRLAFGKDNRRVGVGAKIEQPPETGKGKREFDTDSINAENIGKFNLRKWKTPPMIRKGPIKWGEMNGRTTKITRNG